MTICPLIKKLSATAGVVAAMFASAPASAYIYSLSHLDIQNLVISVNGASAVPTSFTFNLTNNASLNGPTVSSSAACNSFGAPACSVVSPVLDAAAVNAPGSTAPLRTDESTFLGTGNPNASYSGADSIIDTAALVQGVPTSTEQITESLLNTNGFAAGSSTVQSNTGLLFTFNIGSDNATLDLTFLADPDQRAEILDLFGNYLSQSDLSASFTLSRNSNSGGGSISWSPQGTPDANDCNVTSFIGASCVETADSDDLNFNASTSVNPGIDDNSFEAGVNLTPFGITIRGLSAGNYSLALAANTSTSIIRVVPEPATTGLVGAALLGLFLTKRRRDAAKK